MRVLKADVVNNGRIKGEIFREIFSILKIRAVIRRFSERLQGNLITTGINSKMISIHT